jgi:hypothetical protein
MWDIYWNNGGGFDEIPDSWPAPLEYLRVSNTEDIASSQVTTALSGLVDVNGDGLPDVLKADVNDEYAEGTDVDHWLVWWNTGHGFDGPNQWKIAGSASLPNSFGRSLVSNGTIYRSSRELLDITGDGLPDLVDGVYPHFNVVPGVCPICPGCSSACPQLGSVPKDAKRSRYRLLFNSRLQGAAI